MQPKEHVTHSINDCKTAEGLFMDNSFTIVMGTALHKNDRLS